MNEDQLKRQAIFRMVMFFAITIVIGFIASDINILASQQERNMFNLSDETRAAIISIVREKFGVTQTDDEINTVIDEIVDTVKRQFGM